MKHNEPGHAARKPARRRRSLPKAPTGIQGLDELTGGGLPKGRPTLLCGGAGSGKTLLAMEFLNDRVRMALQRQSDTKAGGRSQNQENQGLESV